MSSEVESVIVLSRLCSQSTTAARDFGPRLALTMLGYGKDLWTVSIDHLVIWSDNLIVSVSQHNSAYWSWGIWLSTIPGAIVGGFIADSFIYTGSESAIARFFKPSVSVTLA